MLKIWPTAKALTARAMTLPARALLTRTDRLRTGLVRMRPATLPEVLAAHPTGSAGVYVVVSAAADRRRVLDVRRRRL